VPFREDTPKAEYCLQYDSRTHRGGKLSRLGSPRREGSGRGEATRVIKALGTSKGKDSGGGPRSSLSSVIKGLGGREPYTLLGKDLGILTRNMGAGYAGNTTGNLHWRGKGEKTRR